MRDKLSIKYCSFVSKRTILKKYLSHSDEITKQFKIMVNILNFQASEKCLNIMQTCLYCNMQRFLKAVKMIILR